MEFKEFRAKTVEDAEIDAARAFGVVTSDLEVEVIEKGSAGFLGIGSKQAVIRVRVKEDSKEAPAAPAAESTAPAKETDTVKEKVIDTNPVDNGDLIGDTKAYLDKLFAAMELEATVTVQMEEAEDVLSIDVEGPDMGVLIGKRGQTLDSLQYLASLAVTKETGKYVKVKLDTENYRDRRKATIENLAKNVAKKVKASGRASTLEPMNPYERRIIHAALQDDKYVTTHSEGEESHRKVVVTVNPEFADERKEKNRNSRGGHGRGGYNRGGRGGNRRGYNRNRRPYNKDKQD